jgi:hypothetical protein
MQERLLQLHCCFRQEIPQENFLRILKTAGNNYLRRFYSWEPNSAGKKEISSSV